MGLVVPLVVVSAAREVESDFTILRATVLAMLEHTTTALTTSSITQEPADNLLAIWSDLPTKK